MAKKARSRKTKEEVNKIKAEINAGVSKEKIMKAYKVSEQMYNVYYRSVFGKKRKKSVTLDNEAIKGQDLLEKFIKTKKELMDRKAWLEAELKKVNDSLNK